MWIPGFLRCLRCFDVARCVVAEVDEALTEICNTLCHGIIVWNSWIDISVEVHRKAWLSSVHELERRNFGRPLPVDEVCEDNGLQMAIPVVRLVVDDFHELSLPSGNEHML